MQETADAMTMPILTSASGAAALSPAPTSNLHAARALLPQGWRRDVRLLLQDGRIASIEAGVAAQPGDERHALLLPGLPNLHSHAHQRGMAGLAERRGAGEDSFWSWRDAMYRFALAMTPTQLEAIAAQAYVEMLEAGFTRVGEFHYLHHDIDGSRYANPAEMAARVAAAASATGIALTLLPVYYAHGGFGGTPTGPAQRRFVHRDVADYARLLDASRAALAGLPGAVLGVAPHSLRAVDPQALAALVELGAGSADGPLHIHIAEQTREVDDCIAWCGAPPVQWLLDHAPVDARWCLVHATHMQPQEARRVAASGAVVGLCPITEANLGDGIFDAPSYVDAGGAWGIGSDSNVQIAAADELRLLEYSQRLAQRARNVLAPAQGGSSGRALFDAALRGGHAALQAQQSKQAAPCGLAVGAAADMVSFDAALLERIAAAAGDDGDAVLDAWIYTGVRLVDSVWVGGRRCVEGGRHLRRDAVAHDFEAALRTLGAR